MSRSKSSGRWLREHFDDIWVQKAQKEGYRSRAVYKLLEIHKKDNIFQPGMAVIDLGAAPGGWSQVAAKLIGESGTLIASDILPMDSIADVEFIQGDFTEKSVLDEILAATKNRRFDLVISDMAPNMSGLAAVDIPKAMYLAELALDLCHYALKPGGCFLSKVFQGEGFEQLRGELKSNFKVLKTRKPEASRPRSKELYLLAQDYKLRK